MRLRANFSTLTYLGMAHDNTSGERLAHAWLRSGEQVLTGSAELSRRYTVVGSFAGYEPR